jgi:hypothetical protein
VLDRVREWTTIGDFAGDVCRCAGDLTLVLYDATGAPIGSGTVHPHRVSWERDRFHNDLILANMVELQIFFAGSGIRGSSRSLLEPMMTALNLHEGEAQFRSAGDIEAYRVRRVPPALFDDLWQMSGQDAARVDQAAVDRMLTRLSETEPDPAKVVRELLAWLGTASWPAEAVSGDGQLARRLLTGVDQGIVAQVLPSLTDPSEIMGALVLAAFSDDDVPIARAIAPAVGRVLN